MYVYDEAFHGMYGALISMVIGSEIVSETCGDDVVHSASTNLKITNDKIYSGESVVVHFDRGSNTPYEDLQVVVGTCLP